MSSNTMAKAGRRMNYDKAMRLAGPGIGRNQNKANFASSDASSWQPPEALDAGRKTGARPIRPRIYKHGGKIQGDRAPKHPGKACRGGAYAAGGKVGTGPLSMANVADENKREFGNFHEGGYKRGGMPKAGHDMAAIKAMVHKHERHDHKGEPLTKLAKGGKSGNWMAEAFGKHPGKLHRKLGVSEDKKIPAKKLAKAAASDDPTLAKEANLAKIGRKYAGHADGGRAAHARGGRAKGKTNINIVIAQPRNDQQQMPPQGVVRPPIPPPQMPPPAAGGPPGGMPPGGMPPAAMTGAPGAGGPNPMMRARGGRTTGDAIPLKHAGSNSGEGRLEKMRIQERSNRKRGGRA